MKRLLIVFGVLSVALSGCSSSSFDSSIDQMIEARQKSNQMILQEIENVERGMDYSGEIKEIREKLTAINNKVNSFVLDLEGLPKSERISAVKDFADKNLNGMSYPLSIEVDNDTPLSVLKFVLLDKVNLMFREWQKEATYKFDTLAPVVVFDKANFRPGEAIKGKIYLIAYNTRMTPEITIDDKRIVVENGVGEFSFVPGKQSGELPVVIKVGEGVHKTAIKF